MTKELQKFNSEADYFAVLSNALSICLTCVLCIHTDVFQKLGDCKLWWSEAEVEEESCEQSK